TRWKFQLVTALGVGGRRDALSADERRRDLDPALAFPGPATPDGFDGRVGHQRAEAVTRLMHGCQRWLRFRSLANIVKPHDGDVAWNMKPLHLRRRHRAQRHQVGGAKDGRGSW